MKIEDFGTLQMLRTDAQHFGNGRIVPRNVTRTLSETVSPVERLNSSSRGTNLSRVQESGKNVSFQDYLFEAINTVNSQQNDVTRIQEQLITNPDDVDIHDVTIAMSKARMSLNLAQSVIDRLVSGWNEITTTR